MCPAFGAVLVAFTINSAAYYGEIVRAGIESIPAGQLEAARSTGLGRWQAMMHVVLPQAVRNVAPDLTSNTLELIKATSIASVVALPELLRMGRVAQGLVYNATPLIAVACDLSAHAVAAGAVTVAVGTTGVGGTLIPARRRLMHQEGKLK
jgi:polar amino acid transport system permease protein